ncbi:ATP-binding cassette domain-containing protein [Shimia sp.]|uniref:thiamine ABC transporter ATP-binding protein n=1 Tax=Shimia sp. TaxID=1954381 RepID=UPI003564E8FF
MLTVEDLTLRQGAFTLRAAFSIATADRVAVMGPSGAGKSTLLALLAGFLDPVQGRVLWTGREITKAAPGDRPFAMLFQDNNMFPHLTLAQNVGLGIRPDLRLSAEQKARVAQALARVGLPDMQARKPAQLSGGQQSRAALARILVMDRPLVLLDEPFAALGPALKVEMLDLLAEVLDETGAGLLMVSHDPQDARRIAPMTILVAEGQAHAPAPTAELLDNPPPALRAYLG